MEHSLFPEDRIAGGPKNGTDPATVRWSNGQVGARFRPERAGA
ncbi:hypothetical protein [Paracoccus seriniphilus]|nr:hypothetical protein [Paracoccus seriniphilus]